MKENLKKLNEFEWELDKTVRKEMRVKAKIIANDKIMNAIENEAITQLTNVACLPGIIEPAIGLPDMHWGYGLPMGAVGAFDAEEGIISAGLCGFDINCGINLIRTNLTLKEVLEKQKELVSALFNKIPCGVGSKGKLRLTKEELNEVLLNGVNWAYDKGYATKKDIKSTEENGCMKGADPSKVSDLAKKRGCPQLGTLGAGNHFLEIQKVTDVFDNNMGKKWGVIDKDQVLIMLHCGSRGLGHQVASDYLKIQEKAVKKYNIWLPDNQLVCAPVNSKEGQDFFAAMKAAVNYSFTNRAVITKWIREVFEKVFKKDWEKLEMENVYSIAHNIVKLEEHTVNGKKKKLYVHRKGATRAFPDMPVIIAGSMGTSSYLLKGTDVAMQKTFGSSAHGAGRAMSRHAAIKSFRGEEISKNLLSKGIVSKATSWKSLAEEGPLAYKDIEEVINSVHGAGISLKVARMEPVGVIKG
ncbi:MAG: RtcB family protein [Nanoarchaeota archaeon]|nr:RtcB family protein [Nanoarchaeota archaeon]MBU1445168.1 RtcB family protein [Nanoarchaeota archaeon]MBU2406728.1 RtcB family protein [Nanoarchaeota archaeon]MBU2420881.1 RtcB family protein [Nanoarchaeota archaeon]MBU2475352.1 RtcB family protein [Nanoarchaeota archaeon]